MLEDTVEQHCGSQHLDTIRILGIYREHDLDGHAVCIQ